MISGIHLKGIAQEMLKTYILDVIAEKIYLMLNRIC